MSHYYCILLQFASSTIIWSKYTYIYIYIYIYKRMLSTVWLKIDVAKPFTGPNCIPPVLTLTARVTIGRSTGPPRYMWDAGMPTTIWIFRLKWIICKIKINAKDWLCCSSSLVCIWGLCHVYHGWNEIFCPNSPKEIHENISWQGIRRCVSQAELLHVADDAASK